MGRRLTDRTVLGKEAAAVGARLPRARKMGESHPVRRQALRNSPMSCDVAAAAFLMFAAVGGPSGVSLTPAVAETPPPVASQPLFVDIVGRAGKLKAEVEHYRTSLSGAAGFVPLPRGGAFVADIGQLSALDQQGSDWLRAHSSDGDLKCILHGISQDLQVKLTAVTAAKTGHDEDLALRDMAFLLRDNVEVIKAPPAPAA
jgi:hypothetical protein